jgi:hypothetical protein
MKVSIIPSDKTIIVDGQALTFDYDIDPTIHALQWDGDSGEIEYNDDGIANEQFTDSTLVDTLVSAYEDEVERLEAEAQATAQATAQAVIDEAEALEAAKTYADHRRARYADELPMGDQFDAILKGFNQLRFDGQDLPADLDEVIGIWLGIKSAIPKEGSH